MQNQFDPRTTTGGYDPAVSVGVPRAARDAGLRSYMLKVYNYMASGVLLTGIIALLFAPYARDVLINTSGTGLSGLGWLITVIAGARRRAGRGPSTGLGAAAGAPE